MIAKRALYALRAAGVFHHRSRRSVWLHGDTRDDFARAAELIRDVRAAALAHRIVLTSRSAETCAWLTRRYPNEFALPAPIDVDVVFRRFVHQLRPEVLIVLGADLGGRALVERTRRAGVPIVVRTPRLACADVVTHLAGASIATSYDRAGRVPSRGSRLAASAAGRMLVGLQRGRRLDELLALGAELGSPRTVLCLGNGPSSEDPRALTLAHDALFRVNWRWRARGRLLAPQVVFVGDHRSVWKIGGCTFAFRDDEFEREVRLARALRLRLTPVDTFVVANALPWVRDDLWPARPTNGALMIATAAALRPARLVIAGIDLFAHPQGKYPDDADAENGYAPVHDRTVDLAVIRRALADYRGEVTIIGDALAAALGGVERDTFPAAAAARH